MKPFVQRLHFVGIGGAGMGAIAEVLHQQGYAVSGSDAADGAMTRHLAAMGIPVRIGHGAGRIGEAQAVVASTAIAPDNPELAEARARGVPVVARAQVLAELLRGRLGIAVAGTHGKTTTTSLVAEVLAAAGAEPGFVIGGRLASAGSNARAGHGAAMVVEADESDASFLHLAPQIAIVTNIDADHMATYGHSLQRLQQAFVDFVHRLPFYGRAIVCADDPGVRAIVPALQRPLVRYGLGADGADGGPDGDLDLRGVDVVAVAGGGMRCTVQRRGALAGPDMDLQVALNGRHNVRNALAALAVALLLGHGPAPAQRALAGFAGVGRRFEHHGWLALPGARRVQLVDDYGHHPVELAALLAAARGAWPGRRIVLAFQPHRYSRTRDCLADFVRVLAAADALLLAPVYAAGEAPIAGADSAALAAALRGAGVAVTLLDGVDALAEVLATNTEQVRDGDLLITAGAGSIGALPAALRTQFPDGAGA